MDIIRICPICGRKFTSYNDYHMTSYKVVEHVAEYLEIDLPDHYSGIICNECLENKPMPSDLHECEHCNELILADNATFTYQNTIYCDDCAPTEVFWCDRCEEWHDTNKVNMYSMDFGETWCGYCFENSGVTCEDCGANLRDVDAFYLHGYAYCEVCFDSRTPEEDLPDDDEFLHSYSYKPTPHFFKTDYESSATPLYFGVELELHTEDRECQFYTARAIYHEIEKGDREHCYLKQDGSLNDGIEIVSHPHTLRAWKEYIKAGFGDILSILQDEDNCAYTDEDSGLHIHTSKRGMSDPHKIRYHAFIHEYQDFMESIARRRESSYAQYKHIPAEELKDISQSDRYEAVNWYNDSTVEIRVFKSTFDPAWLLRSIEFCHALYTFTKSHVSIMHIVKGSALKMFFDYVEENKKLYAELFEFTKALNAAGLF